MNAFFKALESGYPPEEILNYLSKAIPQFSSPIRKATNAGYSVQQILGFLSKTFDTEDRQGMSQSERHAANRRADIERAKYGLKIGASALAAPIAGIAARSALSRALPSSLRSALPESLAQSIGYNPAEQNQSAIASESTSEMPRQQNLTQPFSSQPPVSPNIAQTATTQQPEVKTIDIGEILNKHSLSRHVDELVAKNKDPKTIAAILYNKFPKEMQAFQKESGKRMEDALKDYVSQNPKNMQEEIKDRRKDATMENVRHLHNLWEKSSKVHSFEKVLKTNLKIDEELAKQLAKSFEEIKKPEEITQSEKTIEPKSKEVPLKIEKNSTVASPQGIGEVKEIRNGKAIIDVDGKLHKVNEDELEQEPTEIRELDLEGPVSDYLARIPEAQKSSVIDVSLYDEETNELQIRFPNGDQWKYSPVPEEIFDKINSMTGIPITSGESKLRGTIWDTGVANSAGADFYKLIKKLVREGKIKERKLKTGIDLFKGFTRVKKRK